MLTSFCADAIDGAQPLILVAIYVETHVKPGAEAVPSIYNKLMLSLLAHLNPCDELREAMGFLQIQELSHLSENEAPAPLSQEELSVTYAPSAPSVPPSTRASSPTWSVNSSAIQPVRTSIPTQGDEAVLLRLDHARANLRSRPTSEEDFPEKELRTIIIDALIADVGSAQTKQQAPKLTFFCPRAPDLPLLALIEGTSNKRTAVAYSNDQALGDAACAGGPSD